MRDVRRVLGVVCLTAGLTLSASPPVKAAVTTGTVTSSVRTLVSVRFNVVGATISVIHICPARARLNRALVRAHLTSTPTGYRLLSRELWPRGMVTRWRITAPTPPQDNPPLPTQTVFCDEALRTSRGGHDAVIPTIVRVWGPTPPKAELDAFSTSAVLRGGSRRVRSALLVQSFTSKRLIVFSGAPEAGVGFSAEVSASAGIIGPIRAGDNAEMVMNLLVRSGP